MEKLIQLDEQHSVRIQYDENEQPVLLTTYHPDGKGGDCFGTVEIKEGEWKIHQEDPLTISPSIVCDYCPSHVIIKDGKWIDWKSEVDHFWSGRTPTQLTNMSPLTKIIAWLKK